MASSRGAESYATVRLAPPIEISNESFDTEPVVVIRPRDLYAARLQPDAAPCGTFASAARVGPAGGAIDDANTAWQ
jgi:hypothetical protein